MSKYLSDVANQAFGKEFDIWFSKVQQVCDFKNKTREEKLVFLIEIIGDRVGRLQLYGDIEKVVGEKCFLFPETDSPYNVYLWILSLLRKMKIEVEDLK